MLRVISLFPTTNRECVNHCYAGWKSDVLFHAQEQCLQSRPWRVLWFIKSSKSICDASQDWQLANE
jgi:hypothetical protein